MFASLQNEPERCIYSIITQKRTGLFNKKPRQSFFDEKKNSDVLIIPYYNVNKYYNYMVVMMYAEQLSIYNT